MLITSSSLASLWMGFNTKFNEGFTGAPTAYKDVAMVAASSTAATTYAWLGQIPRLREWIGDRIYRNLTAHSYKIENKKFESTIEVSRTDLEDDQHAIYAPLFAELGRSAAEHPDELVFNLLSKGFTEQCYDGQNFFDTEHPVEQPDGSTVGVSNMQDGAGDAWYLLDTSRSVRPLIFQPRVDYKLQRVDQDTDHQVFSRDRFFYGVRGRANAGFGLWQLAYASKAALTPENYALARATMMALRGDEGRPLGIRPDTLVAPPSLEEAARQTVLADRNADGAANVWAGSAKLVVTPWLAE